MAGHEWDWFQREELIGQISDIRVQNLQVERENVQKRTFTRWMNLHLDKCRPPLEVKDLFVDIQDGRILMALLEVLTGQSLLSEYKPSAHRIFRLNNIAKALKFLEDSNVKLVSIDAAEIADGNPSLVLGLIWNIILFLQIKELTGNLNRMSSSSSLSSLPSGTESETSQPSTPSTEKSMSVSIKDQRKAIKALLNWVQQRTRKYGVAVQDFGSSWKSGLAFLALIKAIDSSLVDIKKALERAPRENLQDAFSIAHRNLRIPRLLEPEDLMVDSPDEQSVMTYVTQFLEHFPELDADDFAEQKEDVPLEMTYVHYKDGPIEEEGKIINVTNADEKENGHHKNTIVTSPPRQFDILRYSPLKENVNTEPIATGAPNNRLQALEYKLDPKSGQAKNQNLLDSEEIPPHKSDIFGTDIWTALNNRSKSMDDLDVTHSGYTKDFILPNGRGPVNGSDSPDEHPLSFVLTEPQKQGLNDVKNNQYSYTLDYFHSDKSPVSLFQEDNAKHIQTLDHKTLDDDLATKIIASDKTEPLLVGSSADSIKYVTHLPKNDSDGKNSRRLTVFQVYKSDSTKAEDTTDHEGLFEESGPNPSERSLPFTEVEETSSTDGSEELVSVIPHDLFYYPHYSVAIADVLHAFAEPYPSDSKRKGESTFSPERQDDECESHNKGRLSHKKFKCEIPALGPREPSNAPEVKLPEQHVRTSEVNLETTISPLKLLLKTSAPRESFSNMLNSDVTHSLDDADGIESPGSSEEAWVLSDKSPTYLPDSPQQIFDVEERLEVIQDRAVTPDTNLKEEDNDLWFSRSSHKDFSLPIAKEQNIPDKMIPEAFDMEERSKGNHTESRMRRVGNAHPVEKVEGGTEELSPSFHCHENVYYIILLIWVLFYCILILPELDMSKVTFFSNNGI